MEKLDQKPAHINLNRNTFHKKSLIFKKYVTRLTSSVGQKKNEGRGGIEPQTFRTPTHYQLQAGTQILFLFFTP